MLTIGKIIGIYVCRKVNFIHVLDKVKQMKCIKYVKYYLKNTENFI